MMVINHYVNYLINVCFEVGHYSAQCFSNLDDAKDFYSYRKKTRETTPKTTTDASITNGALLNNDDDMMVSCDNEELSMNTINDALVDLLDVNFDEEEDYETGGDDWSNQLS